MPFESREREVADLILYGTESHTLAPTNEKLLPLVISMLYFGDRNLFEIALAKREVSTAAFLKISLT